MAWTAVQRLATFKNDTTGSTVTATGTWTTANITAGNRIVLHISAVGGANGSTTINTPTDTAGNTYTRLGSSVFNDPVNAGFQLRIETWTAQITAGGGTKPTISVTANFGAAPASSAVWCSASEYSGLDTSPGAGCLDVTANGNGSAGNIVTTTAAAAGAGELIVSMVGDDFGSGGPTTWTVSASAPTVTKIAALSNDADANGGSGAVAEGTASNNTTSAVTWHPDSGQIGATLTVVVRLAAPPMAVTRRAQPLAFVRRLTRILNPPKTGQANSTVPARPTRFGRPSRFPSKVIVLSPPHGTPASPPALAPRPVVARGPQYWSPGQSLVSLTEPFTPQLMPAAPDIIMKRSPLVPGRARLTMVPQVGKAASTVPTHPVVLRRPYQGTPGRARSARPPLPGQAGSAMPARATVLRKPYAGSPGRARVLVVPLGPSPPPVVLTLQWTGDYHGPPHAPHSHSDQSQP